MLESRPADVDGGAEAFDPRAVAASALPSVFLVVAGEFSGSAFAIGKPRGGQTQILTPPASPAAPSYPPISGTP